jgi:hypothetical protein
MALLFAGLGSVEARKAVRKLEELLDAKAHRSQRALEQPVAPQR